MTIRNSAPLFLVILLGCGDSTVERIADAGPSGASEAGADAESTQPGPGLCPPSIPIPDGACDDAAEDGKAGVAVLHCPYDCDHGGPAYAECIYGKWVVSYSEMACPAEDAGTYSSADAAQDGG